MQKRVSPKDKVKVFLIFPNQPWLVNWVHQMDGQCSLGPAVAPASSRPIWSRPQFLASQLRHTKGLPVFKGTRKDEALYANTSPVNSSGTSGTKYQQLWEIQDYLEGYGP